jgi:flagellar hook-associated protein 3 FlgL
MRISTAGMHRSSVNGILEQQSRMARTQQQVTTGLKFTKASEDPIGATRVAILERALAENDQYARNSDIVQTRLNYSDQAMADATNILQKVRELALQGANATLGGSELRSLANEVRQNAAELLDIANRTDSNGEYLYSGTSTNVRPFAQSGAGVTYQGDLVNRQIRISNPQSLSDGHDGAAVFMGIPEGNGVFGTTVAAANTGSGTIDVGSVVDFSQWVPDNYTIQFTTATDWQVIDDTLPTPNVVASGTGFVSGQNISFNGVSVRIVGTPAANDEFTVAPAQRLDMFAMLEQLAAALDGSGAGAQTLAQFKDEIGGAIANLDQSLERVTQVRAEVGTRLSAIDNAISTRDEEAVDLQSLLSDIRDIDYASAISKLNQQYTGLQAAQAAYSRFAQMSLFDFL